VIPTGVDLEALPYQPPPASTSDPAIVFTATMDSFSNIDGIRWFMDAVWPRIVAKCPAARVIIVGRKPDAKLVQAAADRRLPWRFTGFVPEIAPYVHEAAVYVVPLRVGSGTRIKVFEAMALGRPVVSTAIGVEGLQLEPGRHYLLADSVEDFAGAVLRLLNDAALRARLAEAARALLEEHYSFRNAARVFENICLRALARTAGARETADFGASRASA
jgi:glycosyltransferase involved in cell wall biosynthesis